nr:oligopeptide transport system permease protein AppB-like [Nerophis lumbriciformis]
MLGIIFIILGLLHVAPGDPAIQMMGIGGGSSSGEVTQENVDFEARIAAFKKEHALDRSFMVQYLGFLGPFNVKPDGHELFGGDGRRPYGGFLAFDFGKELLNKNKLIGDEIKQRLLSTTLPLALISIMLTYLLALPIGIYSANRAGTTIDTVTTVGLFVMYSIPVFWAGLMLKLAFGATGLGLLPVIGLHSRDAAEMSTIPYLWDAFKHFLMPVTVMTYGSLAYISRQMRTGMIEVIHQDFIRTARAKGLGERAIIFKHALRNSMIPVITIFASILPILIGGSLVIEVVFDLPGMGEYMFKGLLKRDYNIIMATMTLSGAMTLVGILLSDIAYALVDPRIKYS